MITKISIENVKGFGSPAQELNIKLVPGKPNIVVAPNGYGKSSLSKAFDCLCYNGIVLGDTDFHANNTNAQPSLTVEYDDAVYVTDKNRNEVYSHFQCFCINSPLKPKSVTKRIAGQFNQTKDFLEIEEVVLQRNLPIVKTLSYSSSEYKAAFDGNGKILPNINPDLFRIVEFPYSEMEAFGGVRKWSKVQKVWDYLKTIPGSVETIAASIDDNVFSELDALPEYQAITECISRYMHCVTKLDVFLRFWILNKLYFTDKKTFKQAIERNRFNLFLDGLNSSIQALDTTWVELKAIEEGRQLVVRFPKAGSISYGQRDSLFLFASLERIKFELEFDKPVILIVDELFDYLDSVNMTIIQYFFSEFIKYCKKRVEIYPIILTHLSPEYYHNYTFTNMNVQYLGFSEGVSDTPTKRLLKARGNSVNDSPIYEDVSKYLLHYHTGTISSDSTFESMGLRKKWGKDHGFWEYLVDECNKYLTDQLYDYYAISTAVRVRVEKVVFDQLGSAEDKETFLDRKNGTMNKFHFASEKGIEIPDIYSLLGIIYNDAEHLPAKADADKPIIYRLKNPIIKHMIHKVFNMDTPITLNHFL